MDPLLEAASRGDRAARDELVRMFSADVRAFLERQTGSRLRRVWSMSDLCQDVFLQVFRSLDSLPEDADLGVFRGRLLHNARWIIARRARGADGFAGASAAGAVDAEPGAPAGSHTGQVTRGDEFAHMQRLIDRLGPKYRDVVRLRLEGQSFESIATRLERTESAVRKQYLRALETLRGLVDPGMDDGAS